MNKLGGYSLFGIGVCLILFACVRVLDIFTALLQKEQFTYSIGFVIGTGVLVIILAILGFKFIETGKCLYKGLSRPDRAQKSTDSYKTSSGVFFSLGFIYMSLGLTSDELFSSKVYLISGATFILWSFYTLYLYRRAIDTKTS